MIMINEPADSDATLSPKQRIRGMTRETIESMSSQQLVSTIRNARLPFLREPDHERLPFLDRDTLERLVFLARQYCRDKE